MVAAIGRHFSVHSAWVVKDNKKLSIIIQLRIGTEVGAEVGAEVVMQR
jgi:hypothetical protein